MGSNPRWQLSHSMLCGVVLSTNSLLKYLWSKDSLMKDEKDFLTMSTYCVKTVSLTELCGNCRLYRAVWKLQVIQSCVETASYTEAISLQHGEPIHQLLLLYPLYSRPRDYVCQKKNSSISRVLIKKCSMCARHFVINIKDSLIDLS